MSPIRFAYAIVVGLALLIVGGYGTYLEGRKHWTATKSLWETASELAKSNPTSLLLVALGVTAIAAATADRWLSASAAPSTSATRRSPSYQRTSASAATSTSATRP
jgi:hypothetical protein